GGAWGWGGGARRGGAAAPPPARDGGDNLLALAVRAARARCTVGEISDALEAVWGRYRVDVQTVSGVYSSAYENDDEWQALQADIEAFLAAEGRRPRMLVAKMGQDGHDRGARVIATAFADAGFDVDLSPMFATPEEVARQAIENDVHVVGVSSQAAGHKVLVPALIQALAAAGAEDVVVVCGGVIPAQDHAFLKAAGVRLLFGPGTRIPPAAREILAALPGDVPPGP
ncbi:MAG: cobalamin-dependent protein, partial [Gammaproteobacteria bacterium]|nr:cobalamin-dependent protein [Gammaproteobacteria bacterium]